MNEWLIGWEWFFDLRCTYLSAGIGYRRAIGWWDWCTARAGLAFLHSLLIVLRVFIVKHTSSSSPSSSSWLRQLGVWFSLLCWRCCCCCCLPAWRQRMKSRRTPIQLNQPFKYVQAIQKYSVTWFNHMPTVIFTRNPAAVARKDTTCRLRPTSGSKKESDLPSWVQSHARCDAAALSTLGYDAVILHT